VVIAGPTAVGKTQVAISLAQKYDSVIISADSRQIFREMSIGTAKPTKEELSLAEHHFIDHLSISEPYSAGRYAHECRQLLHTLFESHDVLFLVGGAGLYIRSVIEGFDKTPSVSPEMRQKWEEFYETRGLEALQEELKSVDPDFARQVDMQNHRRLIRALSVIETAGKPLTEMRKEARDSLPFHVIRIFCNLPRQELYARIRSRVDEMIAQGLIDEVHALLPYRDTQAMQTVGYKEIVKYLDGEWTLEQAIEKVKQHSCNYAKRQLTWFRNQGEWKEINPPDVGEIERYIEGWKSK
jgi:tRNA dimethylallyltransferase